MDDAEFDRTVKEMTELVMPYVAPLFLLPNARARPQDIVNNGSAALVDTGEKKLLITCHHVWNEFSLYRQDHPDAVIAMGMGNTSPGIMVTSFPLVDSEPAIDIAVVEFSIPSLLNGSEKRFVTSDCWPPARPQMQDIIVAVGWPGINRRLTDDRLNVTFRSTTIVDFVVSVSDRHLVLADEMNQRRARTYRDGVTVDGSHGGMSGCPAFVNRNKRLEFIGIVYEAGNGTRATVFISHASHIKADGTMDRLTIPS